MRSSVMFWKSMADFPLVWVTNGRAWNQIEERIKYLTNLFVNFFAIIITETQQTKNMKYISFIFSCVVLLGCRWWCASESTIYWFQLYNQRCFYIVFGRYRTMVVLTHKNESLKCWHLLFVFQVKALLYITRWIVRAHIFSRYRCLSGMGKRIIQGHIDY